MPDTLMLTSASGRKNFYILIQDRGDLPLDEEKFNPENQGRLLAGILWNMVPWATVQSMMDELDELEGTDK